MNSDSAPAPTSPQEKPTNLKANGSTGGGSSLKIIKDFREQIKKGAALLDMGVISAVVDAVRNTESIDDRKMLLEHALLFTSRLPEGDMALTLQNKIVALLYNDLSHPPATYIGSKYAWRQADGSHNNIDAPDMGKAGTPYSRSVQQTHPLPRNQLPDAGLVFDTLLKREGFVKHPAGLSSMFFSFAALVIHTVFRTSHVDVHLNDTSSYVDLSPLYGHNQEEQDKVRVRDGRGILHPDVFAEDRLLLLPPAVCAILVLFSRNHNYIAHKLLEINERGTYVDPATLSLENPEHKAKLMAQEEELFQIAKLINCGWFASAVFSDYFSCILGLVRQGSSWSLLPFGEIRNEDHSTFERGRGNVCSAEFNCLYRWHATTSQEDEKWVESLFGNIFDGKAPEEITPTDFKAAARKIQAERPDIEHWTFGGLKRKEDGSFRDEDLAQILHNATEHPAAAFRARGTPASMRLHEMMGIEQNRSWGVCSLNDFRKYLGLKPYKTFLEWNPNPEIADAAEKLYGDIDYLELYVGLQAEEAKPVIDGAGLCPGYTISRAILSDAIALTRGDRFFTHDYTPFNLTAWGFADCQRDPTAFGFGSTLSRLFTRTLPSHYTKNSVYTFFPLMTPESMKKYLGDLNVADKYDIARPGIEPKPAVTKAYTEVGQILKNKEGFSTPYAAQAAQVVHGKGFFTATTNSKETAEILKVLSSPESINETGAAFNRITRELIEANSYALVGGKTKCVDIVRDVLKLAPIHWAATEIAGIQLKTKSATGELTSTELYTMLGDIYSFIFLEEDHAKVMVLQEKTKGHVSKLTTLIKEHLDVTVVQKITNLPGTLTRMLSKGKGKHEHQHNLIKRLHDIGHSTDELANIILAILVSSVELSLALTNTVNLYLDSDHEPELRSLSLATEPKAAAFDAYIYEAFRIDPPFAGVYRIPNQDQAVGSFEVKKDIRVFLGTAEAGLDTSAFPEPQTISTSRPKDRYLIADGVFTTLGEPLTVKIIASVLGAIFERNNIRRAPGQSGQLKRFKEHSAPMFRYSYLDNRQFPVPWPTSLVMQYDATPVQKK
ncbi:hypothetical protein HGRIS_004930 [Hohenbuehelia grisea]|uniref:Linoleate diol synthase n=1 Tax=Hohenbuehelia grisea TaxID=104357 RepID=A0ABR3JES2_9AGAR